MRNAQEKTEGQFYFLRSAFLGGEKMGTSGLSYFNILLAIPWPILFRQSKKTRMTEFVVSLTKGKSFTLCSNPKS